MDGYFKALDDRLKKLEQRVFGEAGMKTFEAADKELADNPTVPDRGVAQTVDPRRVPATPGAPMAPYDSNVHYEEGTQEVIDAENDAKAQPGPMRAMIVRDGPAAVGRDPFDSDGDGPHVAPYNAVGDAADPDAPGQPELDEFGHPVKVEDVEQGIIDDPTLYQDGSTKRRKRG